MPRLTGSPDPDTTIPHNVQQRRAEYRRLLSWGMLSPRAFMRLWGGPETLAVLSYLFDRVEEGIATPTFINASVRARVRVEAGEGTIHWSEDRAEGWGIVSLVAYMFGLSAAQAATDTHAIIIGSLHNAE